MDTATAISVILGQLINLSRFATAIQQAHAEGRNLTEAEVDRFRDEDDAARARLQAAIDAAKGA